MYASMCTCTSFSELSCHYRPKSSTKGVKAPYSPWARARPCYNMNRGNPLGLFFFRRFLHFPKKWYGNDCQARHQLKRHFALQPSLKYKVYFSYCVLAPLLFTRYFLRVKINSAFSCQCFCLFGKVEMKTKPVAYTFSNKCSQHANSKNIVDKQPSVL